MKLTVFANIIKESNEISIAKSLEADMLSEPRMLDLLAEKVQSQGFPETFSLPVKISTGVDLTLVYELYEKEINEHKGHHQVTFTYEHTRETTVKIREILKQAEKDEQDPDGDSYDTLYKELNDAEMIHVVMEFSDKITKVYGSIK